MAAMRIDQCLTLLACLGCCASAAASCGSAFCPVNSGPLLESSPARPGASFDLRYEYIHQDQLRSGRARAGAGSAGEDHVEVGTVNRNLLATYLRTFDSGWGVSVTVPAMHRDHAHLSETEANASEPERWSFTGVGDVRLLGRFERTLSEAPTTEAVGMIFGLKVPTGRTTIVNGNGARAERSLQPGSGTTDAILGAYFHHGAPSGATWFVQGQYQHPVNTREAFRPGAQAGLDVGLRYGLNTGLTGLLQLNAVHKQRDSGAQAEPDNSGGDFLFISPGLGYAWSPVMQLYAFVQKPVAQNVNGVQLTARAAFVMGLTSRF